MAELVDATDSKSVILGVWEFDSLMGYVKNLQIFMILESKKSFFLNEEGDEKNLYLIKDKQDIMHTYAKYFLEDAENISAKRRITESLQKRMYEINDEMVVLKEMCFNKLKISKKVAFFLKNTEDKELINFYKSEFDSTFKELSEAISVAESMVTSIDSAFMTIINMSSYVRTVYSKSERRFVFISEYVKTLIKHSDENKTKEIILLFGQIKNSYKGISHSSKSLVSSGRSFLGLSKISHSILEEMIEISNVCEEIINKSCETKF